MIRGLPAQRGSADRVADCAARAERSGTWRRRMKGHGFRKKANEDVYLETVAHCFLNKLKSAK